MTWSEVAESTGGSQDFERWRLTLGEMQPPPIFVAGTFATGFGCFCRRGFERCAATEGEIHPPPKVVVVFDMDIS